MARCTAELRPARSWPRMDRARPTNQVSRGGVRPSRVLHLRIFEKNVAGATRRSRKPGTAGAGRASLDAQAAPVQPAQPGTRSGVGEKELQLQRALVGDRQDRERGRLLDPVVAENDRQGSNHLDDGSRKSCL